MNLAKPIAGFDEPLQMLEACHSKIEAQLGTLERLVPHLGQRGADADAKAAALAVIRYFDTSGVLHHRDEDEDLFPLLRRLAADAKRPEVCAVMDELEREHATMDLEWSRLRQRLDQIARGQADRLEMDLVTPFAWLYRRHMRTEAAAVLPFARDALGEADRAALGVRMVARRKSRA
jgi:hemerythrin-like domain-containing protein